MTTIRSTPARLPWIVTRGIAATLAVTITDGAGTPIDVTGRTYTAGSSFGALTVSTAGAASGVVAVTVPAGLISSGAAVGSWWLTEVAAGVTRPLLDGKLTVLELGLAGQSTPGPSAVDLAVTTTSVSLSSGSPIVLGLDATGVTAAFVPAAQGDGTWVWEAITLLP